MSMATFNERMESIKETGFLDGINGLKKKARGALQELYLTEERRSSDNYMYYLYGRAYIKGERERRERTGDKVISVTCRPVKGVKPENIEFAFSYGEDARNYMEVMLWITDKRLNLLLEGISDQEERALCLDAWIAGFKAADERMKPVKAETTYVLDYDRMNELARAYEDGEEPEPDTEENEAWHAYSKCAELLRDAGCDHFIGCLACPGVFRLLGDCDNGCGDFCKCEEDCANAYRAIDHICGSNRSVLEGYYTVEVPVDEVLKTK